MIICRLHIRDAIAFEAFESASRVDAETKPVGIGMNLLQQKSVCSIVEFLSEHRGCNITNHDHVRFAEYCRRIMTALLPLI